MPGTVLRIDSDQIKRQQSLEAAFAYFSETSEQLAKSYQLLEGKVAQLGRELDRSEAAREQESRRNVELESRMQTLIDFLPGGVIVLDAHGVVIECNPAAATLLSTTIKGKIWRHVIAECFAPKNDDGYEVSTKSGKRLSVSTSSFGKEGQLILLTDQTETRKLQDTLSRSERLSAMGKMVSALAHQIRTPLSAAMLYAGHLCDQDLEQDTQQNFARKCLARLQHMEKQVRDMMLFVKNELPLNDVLNAYELESELKAAAEAAVSTDGIFCEWKNNCSLVTIKCQKDALVSALMNLINNAIQSAEKPVRIGVSFSTVHIQQQRYLRVSVRDDGDGMSHQTLQEIEQVFTTTKAQGTGLGLAVVRSVAKAHGALFALESELGTGTTAYMDIPLISPQNSAINSKEA